MPPVFSADDHTFFKNNGYVIARSVVPPQNLQVSVAMIWEFLGMNPDDPDDWYRPPLSPGGMLEVYQHQALWDNRQSPRVHQAFTELLGTDKLWVSFDRVNMKPPRHPDHHDYDHKGFIHWDTDTRTLPQPFRVQGVLALTDTSEDMGGFLGRNPFAPDLTGFQVTPIPVGAGDLILWNALFPHGNGHNISRRPRFAQYITMFPAAEGDQPAREDRVMRWKKRLPPEASWVAGDPRNWEQEHGEIAKLTPLGRKLLGVDLWEGTNG